jgi:hypothetical protein
MNPEICFCSEPYLKVVRIIIEVDGHGKLG